ncbi:nck-associated protein 1 isoform X2 [Eurytemora carolleeae]|uniref:nck-associated protein 1 isoform X2 n=1 Tax=Eurytemora carolleeae TaxID=1294199 RepID=UPI000C785842|nr:nck-associated protein 1 isoform X2 [Eurytemora carolleeae]|eukprot:XP_023320195.1 nck-associated protein 1-like isoform X2 [Eurytemora affinis]
MDGLDIFSSLHILHTNLLGLQVRMNYIEDNGKLSLLNKLSKKCGEKEITEMLKAHNPARLKTELFQEIETLLESKDLVSVGLDLLRRMERSGMELDLSFSPTLSFLTLNLVTDLMVLLSLIRNVKNIKLLPKIYSSLDPVREDEMKVLENFLEKYSRSVPALTTELSPCRRMLVPCVLSAGKVLSKLENRAKLLVENLLQSSFILINPDELDGNTTISDTFNEQTLSRVVFFSFILLDLPWKVSGIDDSGFQVLEKILSENLATTLFRNSFSSLHGTLLELTRNKPDREKNKKISVLQGWEEKTNSSMRKEHKEKRMKLVIVLEEYLYILEDAPVLIGPKFLMIMTFLSQANSELRWWALHSSFLRLRGEIFENDADIVSLIYYIFRYKILLKRNRDDLLQYSLKSLRSIDVSELREQLGNIDFKEEFQDVILEALDSLETIKDGGNIPDNFVLLFSRLLTVLTVKLEQSSCVSRKSPQLYALLEIICLHGRILLEELESSFQGLDLSFLYSVRESVEELFLQCKSVIHPNLTQLIAFPALCQDLPKILSTKCSEEYEVVVTECNSLATQFLQAIVGNLIKDLDKYVRAELQAQDELQPWRAATKVHQKISGKRRKGKKVEGEEEEEDVEKEIIRKISAAEKQDKSSNKKEKTFSRSETQGILRQNIVELEECCLQVECIHVGQHMYSPPAFLANRIKLYINNFIGMLRSVGNCTVGLEICSLYRDVMMDLQDTKPTTLDLYVTKYLEEVTKTILAPNCHFNSLLNCFCILNNKMEIQYTRIQELTSSSDLTGLVELTGLNGIKSIYSFLQSRISDGLEKVFSHIESGEDTDPKPDFIEPAIQVGKMIKLLELVEENCLDVSRSRCKFMVELWEYILNSCPSHLPVPIELLQIGAVLGCTQTNMILVREKWNDSRSDLKKDRSNLVSAFTRVIPILSRLQTSRFFLVSPSQKDGLITHQNSLEFLVTALSLVVSRLEPEDTARIQNVVFAPMEHLQPSALSLIILIHSFFTQQGVFENGVPYNLTRVSNSLTGLNVNPAPDIPNINQEIRSKRISKFLKDYHKIID